MKLFTVVVDGKCFKFDTFGKAYDCYVQYITCRRCHVVTLYKGEAVFVQWVAEAMAR